MKECHLYWRHAWETGAVITGQYMRVNVPINTETGSYAVLVAAPASEIVGAAQQALVTLAWQTLGVLGLLILQVISLLWPTC